MFQRHTLLAGTSILAGFLGFGAVAIAQEVSTPAVEIGASYSWLHVNSANTDNHRTGNGGSAYVEYNVNKWLGLVADIGGYANTRVDDKAATYLFGPRLNWRHARFTPYAQFLFGGVYAWTNPKGAPSVNQNAFATAAGGGLDYQLTNRIAIKPIQVEYVMTQLDSALGFGSHQNDIRYSAGVVLRIGQAAR
jgi:hypothetical protein